MRLSILVILALAVATNITQADPPAGWGGGGKGYELLLDKTEKHAGKASGSVKATADAEDFGALNQGFRADEYRGKRLRLSAFVKAKDVDDWSGLWMRVDGKDKTGLAFDNMQERAIKGTSDWKRYEIVLDIPADAEEIYFGILLAGKGQVWIDDVNFAVVGNDVKTTGRELEPQKTDRELSKDLPKRPKNLDFEE